MVHIVTAHWNEDLKWLYDLNNKFEDLTISVCDKVSNPNYNNYITFLRYEKK